MLKSLLFAIGLILISMVLRHLKPGYNLGNDKTNVNYFQFMDVLKLIYEKKTEINLKILDTVRRGYSISKRLVKLTRFQDFPSQLPGYQDLPPLSFVLSYQL